MRISKSDKAFVQGVFYAAGFMTGTHGEDSYAKDIIREAGFTFEDGKKYGVEQNDLDLVAKAFGVQMPQGSNNGEKVKE